MSATQPITIALIGAGSNYTPELIEGIIGHSAEALPVAEIRLYDIDAERVAIMGGLSQRMIAHAGRDIALRICPTLDETLPGVDFVITQLRVGGLRARYLDETIPLKYGVIGQETTGPGGMFKALRTIPAMVAIAQAVERLAPQAWILNYTNPSGIITEAVKRHSKANIIGLCSGIPGMARTINERFAKDHGPLRVASIGLNHLGFIHRIMAGDEDVTRVIIDRIVDDETIYADRAHLKAWAKGACAWPIAYLDYFLTHGRMLAHQREAELPRSRQIMKTQRELFAEAADASVVTKPEALKRRGGGGYSHVTFTALQSILHDGGGELVCSVQNHGAVADIEDEAVVEILCTIGHDGPRPVYRNDSIPLAYRGLVQAVKNYETLTVEAAMTRSRDRCYQALLNHPLCGDLATVVPMVDEMLDAHGLEY